MFRLHTVCCQLEILRAHAWRHPRAVLRQSLEVFVSYLLVQLATASAPPISPIQFKFWRSRADAHLAIGNGRGYNAIRLLTQSSGASF